MVEIKGPLLSDLAGRVLKNLKFIDDRAPAWNPDSPDRISDFLHVQYWEDAEELQKIVRAHLDDLLTRAVSEMNELSDQQAFNRMLGLYDNGFVPNADARQLTLDRAQLLSPYRGGPCGTDSAATTGPTRPERRHRAGVRRVQTHP